MSLPQYHLECREVSRQLPDKAKTCLLKKISFGVKKAEVVGVMGPSGSGKSSLLRLLNRLDEPTSGSVFLAERDCKSIPTRELRRRVGMIMQHSYLFSGTVAENVRFGPAQNDVKLSKADLDHLLDQVGLGGFEDRDVKNLSGGEAQRVAITRALANAPEVLLLDEPTSALDENSKQDVETLLDELIHKHGLTCVWVTHDLAQARRVAETMLLLESGNLVASGPTADVLKNKLLVQPSGAKAPEAPIGVPTAQQQAEVRGA